jgi:diguanylate cyclase (GGDEF)-like protein
MGLLGLALAIITGEIYRSITLDNQRQALEEIIHIKVDEVLKDVVKNTSDLGLSLQTDLSFKKALTNKDRSEIERYLNEQFHRFFVTLSIIKLEKLIAFDEKFNVVGASTEGSDLLGPTSVPCPDLLDRAKQRYGAQRLRVISELCTTRGNPVVSVLVPIGGLKIIGYMLTAVDPTLNLSTSEKTLNMPLSILLSSGHLIYQSKNWHKKDTDKSILNTKYILRDANDDIVYQLNFISDIQDLYEQLRNMRFYIIGAAILATLITALLSVLLLQKTALNPLNKLTRQLRLIHKDKSYLSEKIEVSGNTEFTELGEVFNDMAGELNVLYNTLENMAFTDSLTGMPNRALFYERLEQSIHRMRMNHTSFHLLMLDLDRFKYINDTLGHHIGDQLLQEVGRRLQQAVRSTDTIARLGGDEFAAILPSDDSKNTGTVVSEKILKSLNHPIIVGQHNLTVSCSIGLVECPKNGDDINQLMQRADVAMYHAKKNRHGFTFYNSSLDQHNIIQLNLETDLYEALNDNSLELHYQPKVNLEKGNTVAVEALLRWNHPKRGNIPPEEFIPLAEHSGLIHPITRWVVDKSLKHCVQWHEQNLKISVAINLSARSLEDTSILDTFRTALRTSGLDPSYLSVELTESAVMADPYHAMNMLGKLSAMGIQIAVDDFGTGYSSLAYLKKLPVSEIKIDKSFIIDMNHDSNDEVIVHSTIDLAHNMGLSVTAEGVESQETLDKLIKLGCNQAQGHFLCEPCSSDDLSKWFFKSRWGLRANINPAGKISS